jgi:uncharacterized protein YbbC (DUF1343 family)
MSLPGVHFRPALFEPTFHKHAQTPCGGVQIHVTDRQSFRSVATGVGVIAVIRAAAPDRFAWRDPPYEYEADKAPIDILYGSPDLRTRLDAGEPAARIWEAWDDDVEPFLALRGPYLLY